MIDISVIMPVYNSEKYISEAIESILNQTFKNFELIIINDGSTDSSNQIIKSYLTIDSRINYINREINKGLPYTLNEGLLKVKGRYVARMDADDISLPDRIESQFNFFESNKEIYLIGTSYIVFNSNGIMKTVSHPTNPIELAYKCISNTYFCHPSIMFRSEILRNGLKYESVEAEDFKFISEIIRIYPCSNIKKPLLRYREHNLNRSFTVKKELFNSIKSTTEENINILFKNRKNRLIYKQYRLNENKTIFQYLFCFILDIYIIMKIFFRYNKFKYFGYSITLLINILTSNIRRLIIKITKKND